MANINCSSTTREFVVTPIVDVQRDEDAVGGSAGAVRSVLSDENDVSARVHQIEGAIENLNVKLDSRLNSQRDFEGKLPKYLLVFSVIVIKPQISASTC